MIISLIGMPGSFKTASGKLLADKLHYCFLDTDDIIKDRLDRDITEIFEDLGEAAFRVEETETLRDCILLDNTVISCGGGIILNEENRKVIGESSYSIWLDTSPSYIMERASSDRPLLKNKNIEEIAQMKEDREWYYSSLAKEKIITDEKSPEDISDEIYNYLINNKICGGNE